jgi:hypothetical protein
MFDHIRPETGSLKAEKTGPELNPKGTSLANLHKAIPDRLGVPVRRQTFATGCQASLFQQPAGVLTHP